MADTKRQAQALLASGRVDAAKRLLIELCNREGADPDAWLLLGITHSRLASWDEAVTCFRTALTLRPRDINATLQLGNAFLALRQYQEAIPCYRQCLAIDPQSIDALNNLGRALHLAGTPEEAVPYFERVLKIDANIPTTIVNLALAHLDAGRPLKAIEYLQQGLRLKPNWPQVQMMLGQVYVDVGMHDFAARCFRDVIQQDPGSEKAYVRLGVACRLQGQLEPAREAFRNALRLRPDCVDAAVGEVIVDEYAGNEEQATASVRQLLERNVRTPDFLALFADMCKRMNACDKALELIQEALRSAGLSRSERATLWFSVGKLYDERGDYEHAFEAFEKGNQSVNVQFDPEAHRTHLSQIMTMFSAEAMRRLPRARHGNSRPIFIVGMPRSGTTLLEQILSGHPEIYGAGELPNITVLVQSLPYRLGTQELYPGCMRLVAQRHMDAMADEYLSALQMLAPGGQRVTDKMPHNFYHLGLINLLFPEARVIHCVRNPMDTCLSIYFRYFGPVIPYAYSLKNIAAFYNHYRMLMAHWETTLDMKMSVVSYREVVDNPETTVRRLLSELDLPWSPDCLNFHSRRRTVVTASYQQVRRPLYKTAVERWRHYEAHLGALREALTPWIE